MDIIQKRLVTGDWIGSESELMERYGVSRGVVREATTLVEHHMQAHTRRGAGGGLVVMEPDVRAITEVASLFLARKQVSLSKAFETRILLEVTAVEELMASLDDDKIQAIRTEAWRTFPADGDLFAESERFHLLLAELTSNGVQAMLTSILCGLVREIWTANHRKISARQYGAFLKRVNTEHRNIAEKIISGDVAQARLVVTEHLQHISDTMQADQRVIAPLEMAEKHPQAARP
jgi:DNA-binding FadR family transcriptional regulator